MKILVISHFQGEGLPTAIFVFDQVRAYREKGADVRLLIPVPWGKLDYFGCRINRRLTETTIDGITCYFIRYLSVSNLGEPEFNAASAVRAIRFAYDRIFSDFSPNIIQAHTLGFDSIIGNWLKEQLHCPLVLTTHGSDTSIPYAKGKKDSLRKYCMGADSVVCVSSKLKHQLEDCGVEKPLYVISNGFNLQNQLTAIPSGLDWIQVGNLLPQKHVETTLRAFQIFHENYPQSICRIVGQGPEQKKLELLCNELGITDSVRFLGQIENSLVYEEMARSRFFVMVSHPEGFGVVYLEAMFAGCVTIGTEGEGIADIIENGINGFLVPPDDIQSVTAIALRCALDPQYSDAISRAGADTARGLTWQKNGEEYLRLFKEIILS